MEGTVILSTQERIRAERNRNQRCGYYSNPAESEYDVVDDQEEVLNVRILPAQPINEEREYAGKEEHNDTRFSSDLFNVDFSVSLFYLDLTNV